MTGSKMRLMLRQARRLFGQPPRGLPLAWFLTDDARIPDPLAIAAALPSDVGVILRDYRRPDRVSLAREMVALCRAAGRPVLIAGDAALAKNMAADGVHLPRWAAGPPPLDGDGLVSCAVHDRGELARARRLGADFIIVSPVFETPSHPDAASLGRGGLARLMKGARQPVYALGGMSPSTLRRLRGLSLAGFAGIDCFL
ncbi:MAG: thiamine phosphate synthase [Pseudomonadota bacterium]